MEKIFHEIYLFLTTLHNEDKLQKQQFNLYLTSTLAFFCTDLLKRYFFRKFGWEVLYVFDSEAAVRVSGAAETVDYFG